MVGSAAAVACSQPTVGGPVTHAGSHDNAPVLLTVAEAADFLRTPVATLRYWRHMGIGPTGFRLGRRVVYSRADLISWLAQQREAEASR